MGSRGRLLIISKSRGSDPTSKRRGVDLENPKRRLSVDVLSFAVVSYLLWFHAASWFLLKKSLQALRHAYMWYYVVWVCLGLYTSYFKPEDGLTKPKAKRCKCKVSSLGQTPRRTNPREMPPSGELEQSFHRRRCLHPKPATKVEALDTESKPNVYICIIRSYYAPSA